MKEEQRDIGKQWQKQSEDLLKKSPLPQDGAPWFGRTTPRMKEWKKDLAEGKTESMQRDLEEMKKLADLARNGKSEEEKEKGAAQGARAHEGMQEFAKNEGANANLAATLSQALQRDEPVRAGRAGQRRDGATQGNAGCRRDAGEDLAQSMRDLKSLEKAMSAIQKARQANKASEDGLDGEQCEGDMTMEEYAQLYDEIMKQCQGGMAANGQGQGQGQGQGDGRGTWATGTAGVAAGAWEVRARGAAERPRRIPIKSPISNRRNPTPPSVRARCC